MAGIEAGRAVVGAPVIGVVPLSSLGVDAAASVITEIVG
jgi:hypothetical protein